MLQTPCRPSLLQEFALAQQQQVGQLVYLLVLASECVLRHWELASLPCSNQHGTCTRSKVLGSLAHNAPNTLSRLC